MLARTGITSLIHRYTPHHGSSPIRIGVPYDPAAPYPAPGTGGVGRGRAARRRALAAAALGAALAAFTGIAPASARAAASGPTLRLWYATDDPTESSWAQSLATGFEAQHRGVTVRLTTYQFDDMNTKLQLALSAGDPPDLIYTTPRGPGIPAYVRAGQLRDLASVASSQQWAARLRPGLLAAYNRLLAPDNASARHIYATPYDLAAVAVLYNRSIFSRLHMQLPRTVHDLDNIAARAKSAGIVPFGLGNADGWLGDDWWQTLVNADAGPAALAPELQLDPHFSFHGAAFTFATSTLKRWADDNDFTPNFGGLDAQDGVNAFFQGKTALQLISSTENSQILQAVRQTRLDVGVFAFPSVDRGHPAVMPMSGYEGWAIPRASHQAGLAAQFIDFALSPGTARLLLDHGLLPAVRLDSHTMRPAATFQRDYFDALGSATPGVYLDGAPVPNLNATMEANIQLLMQDAEAPSFLLRSLQSVYASRGAGATQTRTDGEF